MASFTPSTRFHETDLVGIENEFLDSTKDIQFNRTLSKLFPTNAEAKERLEKHSLVEGTYQSGRKVLLGLSPRKAESKAEIMCGDGRPRMDPKLFRLFTGLHESAHLFMDLKYKKDFTNLVNNATKDLSGKYNEKELAGIGARFGEAIADMAAMSYMLNKYPNAPAIKDHLKQIAGYRAAPDAMQNSYLYNNSGMIEKFLTSIQSAGNKRDMTPDSAAKQALDFMDKNRAAAVADLAPTLNMERLNRDTVGNSGKFSDKEWQDIKNKNDKNAALKKQFCGPGTP